MVQNGPNGPKWSKMVQNGPKWSKMVQNVSNIPNSSKLVLTCPNSSEWVRTGQDGSGRVRMAQDRSGRLRTGVRSHPNLSLIQLNLTPKYYIQSPLPLPATLFQRPLDNFMTVIRYLISNISFTLIVWPIFSCKAFAPIPYYQLPWVKTGRNKKIMADFLDPFFWLVYRLSLSSCDVWNHQLGAATLHAHELRDRILGTSWCCDLLFDTIGHGICLGEQLLISSWIGHGCWSFMSSCRDHMCPQNRSWWWKSQDPFQLERSKNIESNL